MRQLTTEGRAWAEKAAHAPVPSMIAVVALSDEAQGWPEAHRETAIRQANELGRLLAASKEVPS